MSNYNECSSQRVHLATEASNLIFRVFHASLTVGIGAVWIYGS